ncbi:hypothetical protein [Solimonas marina]|uniref:Uncharacterized protein n=1 Tax=Solimonas marina TaxID=2714601 RepID=A0A969W5W5_9GAMM|nr:hypothetical protein [Solimonas marina]NKF21236.1 hypothetical protein [Solimonas marina]
MTLLLSLSATLPSVLALLWLAWRDPKRRRTAGLASGPAVRRLAVIVLLLPGAALIALGAWAELLIWAGLSSAAGWLFTQGLAVPGTAHRSAHHGR